MIDMKRLSLARSTLAIKARPPRDWDIDRILAVVVLWKDVWSCPALLAGELIANKHKPPDRLRSVTVGWF